MKTSSIPTTLVLRLLCSLSMSKFECFKFYISPIFGPPINVQLYITTTIIVTTTDAVFVPGILLSLWLLVKTILLTQPLLPSLFPLPLLALSPSLVQNQAHLIQNQIYHYHYHYCRHYTVIFLLLPSPMQNSLSTLPLLLSLFSL